MLDADFAAKRFSPESSVVIAIRICVPRLSLFSDEDVVIHERGKGASLPFALPAGLHVLPLSQVAMCNRCSQLSNMFDVPGARHEMRLSHHSDYIQAVTGESEGRNTEISHSASGELLRIIT
jgi:hypothetical protein